MKGFIPIRRTLFNHFLFKEKRCFSRFEAWLDLIQLASFTDDNTDMINGKAITKNRGQIVASVRYLATRWEWSLHKVTGFIELLRSHNMVVVDKENGISILTLVNFEKHNSVGESELFENGDSKRYTKRDSKTRTGTAFGKNAGTPKGTATDTVAVQRGDSEGTNSNKDNKDKEGEVSASHHTPTLEEKELFKQFQEYLNKNAPRVTKMQQPITIEEYLKLRKKVDKAVIKKVLRAMDNRADLLKKNLSAYKTILNWSEREDGVSPSGESKSSEVNNKIKAALNGSN
jgi:hypothetical protein